MLLCPRLALSPPPPSLPLNCGSQCVHLFFLFSFSLYSPSSCPVVGCLVRLLLQLVCMLLFLEPLNIIMTTFAVLIALALRSTIFPQILSYIVQSTSDVYVIGKAIEKRLCVRTFSLFFRFVVLHKQEKFRKGSGRREWDGSSNIDWLGSMDGLKFYFFLFFLNLFPFWSRNKNMAIWEWFEATMVQEYNKTNRPNKASAGGWTKSCTASWVAIRGNPGMGVCGMALEGE